jgi:hypothetical protein
MCVGSGSARRAVDDVHAQARWSEPAEIRLLTFLYWEHRRWIAHLETRIARTDAGLVWLMRVRAI